MYVRDIVSVNARRLLDTALDINCLEIVATGRTHNAARWCKNVYV